MIGRLLHRLAIVLPVLAAVVLMPHEAAAVTCPGGRTMHIVAHQDDDIVFFGTDVIADLNAGRCVTTVCLTAGDAGGVASYWLSRERGAVDMRGYWVWTRPRPMPALPSARMVWP